MDEQFGEHTLDLKQNITFVDNGIDNYQDLLLSNDNTQVVILNSGGNEIEQITEYLSEKKIFIVSKLFRMAMWVLCHWEALLST